jgi:G3E family GTPase
MAASSPPFDALIVEASGISEPQQIAEAFDLPTEVAAAAAEEEEEEEKEEEEEGESDDEADRAAVQLAAAAAHLRAHARLDCSVSVVDALQFPRDVQSSRDSLQDLGTAAGADDERAVSALLIQQVEFANVLVLNKCDLIGDEERGALLALLRALNPRAQLLCTTRSAVNPRALLRCGAFSMDVARASPGWLQSLSGAALPESEEFGISHVVFRERRPFHPRRLHELLFGYGERAALRGTLCVAPRAAAHPLAGVVRSKGGAWLAAEVGVMHNVFWAQAGRAWSFSPGRPWAAGLAACLRAGAELADGVAEEVAADAAASTYDAKTPGVGDRTTELVLIGVRMDGGAVLRALASCVVSDAEWDAYVRDAAAVEAAEAARMIAGDADGGGGDDAHTCAHAAAAAPQLDTIDAKDWLGPWDLAWPEEEGGGHH